MAYRIPTLEAALALKFAAMLSPNRTDKKKHYDAGDFIGMTATAETIDLEKLNELGELVYTGGGTELLERVRRARAGEKLDL